MKLLSVAIPCYNSEAYMRNCIHSLLAGGEEVEIIIVDDGSKDGTAAIADEYAEKYPGPSLRRSIRKTAVTARQSTQVCATLPAFISRWWTATTGYLFPLIRRF